MIYIDDLIADHEERSKNQISPDLHVKVLLPALDEDGHDANDQRHNGPDENPLGITAQIRGGVWIRVTELFSFNFSNIYAFWVCYATRK